jgi:hypothetical protein
VGGCSMDREGATGGSLAWLLAVAVVTARRARARKEER